MCGPIKGAARGLNPIDPGVYGPACSTRAKPEGYICLPECVDFGNVDLSKAANCAHPTSLQYKYLLCRVVQKAAMGQQRGLHASDRSL